ncbi:hypothetical protein, partial [Rhizobium ruizarguesonis]|uniref:hypothetical protein n=1 Tax=Rhizobium ruizarguesonis TaxID=2081791 RepID=UPI001954A592
RSRRPVTNPRNAFSESVSACSGEGSRFFMAESNHDLPRLENPQASNHFSKRAVMHTSMTAHQNAAMDFAPRTKLAINGPLE